MRKNLKVARNQGKTALRNSLPEFLDELAEALSPKATKQRACDGANVCREHGQCRAEVGGYSMEEVIWEYHMLRQSIFEVLEEDGQALPPNQRDCILDSILQGISEAVVEFVRIKNEQADSDHAASRSQEALLQAILASAPFGIGFMDTALRYVRVNETLARMNGHPAEKHIGKTIYEVMPEYARVIDPVFKRLIKTKKPAMNRDIEMKGSHLLGNFYPVCDDEGLLLGIGMAITDITERKQVEEGLKSALAKLEEEKELRERFVSTLTHDLRTPLTAALVSADMIKRNPDQGEKHEKLVTRIIDNLGRVDRMIQDLLDANLIKAGETLPLEVGDCDLKAVISDVLDEMRLLHGDRFAIRCDEEMRGTWSCDGLRRVAENLVKNAVKYGDPKSPITVTLKWQATGEAWISVHNFGNELSPAEQRTLFELYRRTSSAKGSGKQGWGIGLPLVKGIVEAHGGRVWVESVPGDGTTFHVSLPRHSRNGTGR